MFEQIECLSCPFLKICASQLYKIIDVSYLTNEQQIDLKTYCYLISLISKKIEK